MSRWGTIIGGVVLASIVSLAAASAQEIYPDDQLVGTMWSSQEPYGWTSVTHEGEITERTTDGNFLEILDYNDGVYVFMLNWWNEEAGLDVVEYGVLVSNGDNSFVIIEADDRTGDHGGIVGEGYFQISDRNTAQLIQLGFTADGSAAAFSSTVTRVEAPANVPLPQSPPSR